MKKITFILMLTMSIGLMNCGDKDEIIDLPATIDNYLTTNYPDYTVDESAEETLCDGTIAYEVELEDSNDNEIELTFSMEGNLLFTETEINTSELPTAVSNSISTNYADYTIDEADRLDMADGSVQYEVEIENGNSELEVILDTDGSVICEQVDDED